MLEDIRTNHQVKLAQFAHIIAIEVDLAEWLGAQLGQERIDFIGERDRTAALEQFSPEDPVASPKVQHLDAGSDSNSALGNPFDGIDRLHRVKPCVILVGQMTSDELVDDHSERNNSPGNSLYATFYSKNEKLMRFLMLNWRDPKNPRAGGAERVTLGYLSELVRRGHEVFWYSFSFSGAPETDEVAGIQIVRGGGTGTAVKQAIQWYRRQAGFDLVIDQHHGIPWFAPWWCRTRCIAYIHEVLGPIWDAFYGWPINVFGRTQERWTHWLYRRVPFWTACQSTKDDLQAHGVRNVTLIPYGVHTQALSVLPEKPLSSPLRLVVVSRLAPNKRVDQGIRTAHILTSRGVDTRLEIVGTGESEPHLRQLTGALKMDDRVCFAGPLAEAEKDERLRQGHFLLHTSQREGWGLNVIEANAMGTPAAVYPVKGLIESTLHDRTGLVAPAETPESLAASIQSILDHPNTYQRYRSAAWERAKSFHWSQVLPPAVAWLEGQAQGAGG